MKPSSLAFALLVLGVPAAALPAQDSRLDSLDAYVRSQMARRHISGVSLAIIQDGKIAVARGYGVADEATRAPVTTRTLFQAGSISKPVSALGALHLVEAGALSLDGNVNDKLTSWKVPENRFTAAEKVTLRRILSHSAGLTVHGFPGYDAAEPAASLIQVLDGASPANTAAIRVDTTPGAIWRYSGGGFTVMQQLMIDVSGVPFPEFMRKTVLAPAGMNESSFEQPQPQARAALTATGYYADRTPVRGRWHVYPEMAAAGLWTTPSDLARFAIEIQQTLAGKGHGIISAEMAHQYLTVQKGGSGLGIGVRGTGRDLSFSHGGRDEGFDAQLVAFAETGQGAVLMINANDNSRFMGRILDFIGRAYHWPAGDAPVPAVVKPVPIGAAILAQYAGYYEMDENQMGTLVPNAAGTGLETLTDGLPDDELLAIDSIRFGSLQRPFKITVTRGPRGEVNGILWGPAERRAPRVAPLPSAVTPVPDPDRALTTRIGAALDALRNGGPALADARGITPGAKKDLGAGQDRSLEGLAELRYLGEEDVGGRGIHRHGHDVARVRLYRVTTKAGPRYLFVHLTADADLTDYDVVTR
jgi:CubicO group peptidase (beta-lactamase class C family)